jgi:hypothetical protein
MSVEHARVCTYLIDLEVSELSGDNPLAPFQAMKADFEGTWRIVESINNFVSAHAVDKLRRVFEKWWPEFINDIENFPKDMDDSKPQRPEREILEELVSLIRNQGGVARETVAQLGELKEHLALARTLGSQPSIPQSSLYYGPGLLAALDDAIGRGDSDALAAVDKAMQLAGGRAAARIERSALKEG